MHRGREYGNSVSNGHSLCFIVRHFFLINFFRCLFLNSKILVLLVPAFFVGLLYGFAQSELSFSSFSAIKGDSSKFSTGFSGDVFLNSNALNNNFFHEFNKKGFISEDIKDEISQKLYAQNRAGADLNYGIFFSKRINPSWNFLIQVSDRAHLDVRFPKDLFDLTFYGNRRFAGDTAFLDNTTAGFLRFQQIQAGIVKTSGNGNRSGFSLSYLKGEENFSLKLNRARLVTDEKGESLDADFNFEFFKSDTAKKGMDAFNGWGISSDIFTEFPFTIKEHKSVFRAELNDIGIIQWNEQSLIYKADTSMHFEGAFVPDILHLDSILNTLSPDSISDDIQSALTREKYSTLLPAMMKFTWMIEANNFLYSFGIFHRLRANYTPFAYIKTGYKISSLLTASAKVSYGGYGKISVGTEMNICFRNYYLIIGSNNLEGLAIKKYSGGNSAFFALRKEF